MFKIQILCELFYNYVKKDELTMLEMFCIAVKVIWITNDDEISENICVLEIKYIMLNFII